MGTKQSKQGNAYELEMVEAINRYAHLEAEHLAEEGSKDKGDIRFSIKTPGRSHTKGGAFIFYGEVRDREAMGVHRALQAQAEKTPVLTMPILFWRRKELKEGNVRRTRVGPDVVVMHTDMFLWLLSELALEVHEEAKRADGNEQAWRFCVESREGRE